MHFGKVVATLLVVSQLACAASSNRPRSDDVLVIQGVTVIDPARNSSAPAQDELLKGVDREIKRD